ncbi:transposase [Acidocella sp.]|uniref:transposase n=1 Tax=Acidocella sp. TaxID=50710 RepID=UPI00261FA606|nr:transposase [Acidocella sp.]
MRQLYAAIASSVQAEAVLDNAGYGNDTNFYDGIAELGTPYVVGIQSAIGVWPPGKEPLPPHFDEPP